MPAPDEKGFADFGTAVILAGGESRRMGFDKQTLRLGETDLMAYLVETLACRFPDILIVTNMPERYRGWPVRLTRDHYRGSGPLAGLHAGLAEARSQYIFLRANDMPVYQDAFIRHMMNRLLDHPAQVCVSEIRGFLEPFNGFYHRALLSDVAARLERGEGAFQPLFRAHEVLRIPEKEVRLFDPTLSQYTNLNTMNEVSAFLSKRRK